ncbi:hypothetical protein EV193_103599 [Herbihabitans rhizosphaerae]|uniref:Uncharacterized protein n=1 Tax=Herbihabitans rhizosphaerae TaxID=1872711 RepID=A0A4Q7KX48_9PSEU|nr:hypothetical protein [Herbihabitans rhizosphaerae]RZS41277.1 hypothetical protein EV193_103599 [Herbihabitans rhizosphaerae]
MKAIIGWTIGLLVGLAAIYVGVVRPFAGDEVTCGHQPMRQGQTCEVVDKGTVQERRTFEQQKQAQRDQESGFGRWALVGLGGALALYSVYRMATASRRRDDYDDASVHSGQSLPEDEALGSAPPPERDEEPRPLAEQPRRAPPLRPLAQPALLDDMPTRPAFPPVSPNGRPVRPRPRPLDKRPEPLGAQGNGERPGQYPPGGGFPPRPIGGERSGRFPPPPAGGQRSGTFPPPPAGNGERTGHRPPPPGAQRSGQFASRLTPDGERSGRFPPNAIPTGEPTGHPGTPPARANGEGRSGHHPPPGGQRSGTFPPPPRPTGNGERTGHRPPPAPGPPGAPDWFAQPPAAPNGHRVPPAERSDKFPAAAGSLQPNPGNPFGEVPPDDEITEFGPSGSGSYPEFGPSGSGYDPPHHR